MLEKRDMDGESVQLVQRRNGDIIVLDESTTVEVSGLMMRRFKLHLRTPYTHLTGTGLQWVPKK